MTEKTANTNLDAKFNYTGALFATRDAALMTGPFQLPGHKVRAVCELGAGQRGEHMVRLHRVNKDGALSKKPIAVGYFRRTARFDMDGVPPRHPVGRGQLTGKDRVVPLVVFFNRDDTGRCYYRLAADNNEAEASFELPRI